MLIKMEIHASNAVKRDTGGKIALMVVQVAVQSQLVGESPQGRSSKRNVILQRISSTIVPYTKMLLGRHAILGPVLRSSTHLSTSG